MTGQQLFWEEMRLRWTRSALLRLGLACLLVLLVDAAFTLLYVRTGLYDLPKPAASPAEISGIMWRWRIQWLSHLGNSPFALASPQFFATARLGLSNSFPALVRLWSSGLISPLLYFVMPGVLSLAFLSAKWRVGERLEEGIRPRALWWGMGGAAALPFLVALALLAAIHLLFPYPGSSTNTALLGRSMTSVLSWTLLWVAEGFLCLAAGAIARRKDVALLLAYGSVFVFVPALSYVAATNNPVPPELFILRGVADFLLRNLRSVATVAGAFGLYHLSLWALARRSQPQEGASGEGEEGPAALSQPA